MTPHVGGKCERCGRDVGQGRGLYFADGGRSVCWDCVKFEYPLGTVQAGGAAAK